MAKIDGNYVVNYDGQDSSLSDIGFDLGTINISNGIITGAQPGLLQAKNNCTTNNMGLIHVGNRQLALSLAVYRKKK